MAVLQIIVDTDTGKATSEFKDLNKELGNTGKETETASSGVDTLVGAFKAFIGLQIVKQIAETVWELGNLGIQVEAAESKFQAFAGSAENAREILLAIDKATDGTVDQMTAMTSATKLMQMGLAQDADEIAKVIELAVRLGDQTQSAGDRVADFSALLANQSIPRLDNFGISSARVRARVEELTSGVDGLSREVAFTQAVLEAGAGALDTVNSGLTDAQIQSEQSTAGFQNLRSELGQAFMPAVQSVQIGLGGLFNAFAEQQRMTNIVREEYGGLRGSMAAAFDLLGFGNTLLDQQREKMQYLNDRIEINTVATERMTAQAEAYAASQEPVLSVTGDSAAAFDAYNNALIASEVAANQAASAAAQLAEANAAAQEAALATQSAYLDSAAALDELSTKQFAQAQIAALQEAGVSGEAFVEAQQEILMHFGLLTEEELQQQTALDTLIQSYADGEVAVDTLGSRMESIMTAFTETATATEAESAAMEMLSSNIELASGTTQQFSDAAIVSQQHLIDMGMAAEEGAPKVNTFSDNVNFLASDANLAAEQVKVLGESINDLPDEKEVNVVYRIKVEGEIPTLPSFQFGGFVPSSGSYLVGERGPEMVTLPAGARVASAPMTQSITNNYNLSVTSGRAAGSIVQDFEFMRVLGA